MYYYWVSKNQGKYIVSTRCYVNKNKTIYQIIKDIDFNINIKLGEMVVLYFVKYNDLNPVKNRIKILNYFNGVHLDNKISLLEVYKFKIPPVIENTDELEFTNLDFKFSENNKTQIIHRNITINLINYVDKTGNYLYLCHPNLCLFEI